MCANNKNVDKVKKSNKKKTVMHLTLKLIKAAKERAKAAMKKSLHKQLKSRALHKRKILAISLIIFSKQIN